MTDGMLLARGEEHYKVTCPGADLIAESSISPSRTCADVQI